MKKLKYYRGTARWLKFYMYILLPYMIISRIWDVIQVLLGTNTTTTNVYIFQLVTIVVFCISYLLIFYLDTSAYFANIALNIYFISCEIIQLALLKTDGNLILGIFSGFMWFVILLLAILIVFNLLYFHSKRTLFFTSIRILKEDYGCD